MKLISANDTYYEVLAEYTSHKEHADIARLRWARLYDDIVMLAPMGKSEWLVCRKVDDADFETL